MFSSAELADLRTLEVAAMPQTCVIVREATVSPGASTTDIFGRPVGDDVTGGPAEIPVACRVVFSSTRLAGEGVRGGQIRPFGDAEISFPYGTVVLPSDVVQCDGREFDVAGMNTGRGYQTATVVAGLVRT